MENQTRSEVVMKFKSMFEQERKNLLYSNRYVNEDFHFQTEDLADEADITATEMETEMRMRLRNRETLYLKKIDEALKRISDGTFGSCEVCDEDIEMKRLEVRPTTTMCVGCKEESERRESLHIDGHRSKSLGKRLRLA
ncbi:MAG: TraR/DksA C4-type zinc finger protein [Bdellovibrionales bacterium]|nr:TraR/DksA C4-type zinc finger protein [Bdellovibrionales bacterium]